MAEIQHFSDLSSLNQLFNILHSLRNQLLHLNPNRQVSLRVQLLHERMQTHQKVIVRISRETTLKRFSLATLHRFRLDTGPQLVLESHLAKQVRRQLNDVPTSRGHLHHLDVVVRRICLDRFVRLHHGQLVRIVTAVLHHGIPRNRKVLEALPTQAHRFSIVTFAL
uniref:(northern house mosquito) hypothetical protein n=1 Tax=Culex pipiens TaxID=7175 RepID=A0A8D8A6G2_CULPI